MAMINLPNLQQLYNTTPYTNIFLYTLLWNVGIYGMAIFVLFLILLSLKLYQVHRDKQIQQSRQSLLTYQSGQRQSFQTIQRSSSSVASLDPGSENKAVEQQKKFNLYKFLNLTTSIFFYLTLVSIACIYTSFYIFGGLGRGTGHDILAVLIISSIIALPTILWKRKTRRKNSRISKKQLIFTGVMIFVWILISTALVITLRGVCVCLYNSKYGANFTRDVDWSTQFSRALQIQKICKDGEVCHLYATLPENASDSVFINVHTGTDIYNITVILQAPADPNTPNLQPTSLKLNNNKPYKMTNVEQIAKRHVFSLLFTDLKPNINYKLTVKQYMTGNVLKQSNYLTLPNENADQLRFAEGGDIGIGEDTDKLTSYLIQFNPHVILVGGDNVYDDAMRTCFYSWDNAYDLFNQVNQKLNRLVPLVFSVGNHDVGYHAMSGNTINFRDPDNMPYFFLFNPQHKLLGTDYVPQAQDRLSYHYHIIGPTVHLHLDSGYIYSHTSQRALIDNINKKFPNLYKFANYHNPVYPSCTDSTQGSNDRRSIQEGLKNWTPLFDQGNFVAAFQHHTHYRKFTHKIKGNQVQDDSQQGTRYVGDGSWGVPEDPCPEWKITKHPQYFQHTQTRYPNHIWLIKLFKNVNKVYTIEYRAVDLKKTTVFQKIDNL